LEQGELIVQLLCTSKKMEQPTKMKGTIGTFYFDQQKYFQKQQQFQYEQFNQFQQPMFDEPQKTLEELEKEFTDSIDEQFDCKHYLYLVKECSTICLSSNYHWKPKEVSEKEELCYNKCSKKMKEFQTKTKYYFEKNKDLFL
jgi:hypothetical protein